jgi:hypothetical protein
MTSESIECCFIHFEKLVNIITKEITKDSVNIQKANFHFQLQEILKF